MNCRTDARALAHDAKRFVAHTTTTAAYPAVHDMPPQRGTAPMTDADRQAAEADMVAARERQVQEATPSTPVSTKTKRRKDPGT